MKLQILCNSILLSGLLLLGFGCVSSPEPQGEIALRNWKFKTGDSLAYAEPNFNTESWSNIDPVLNWETQGFDKYDGYAWYRTSFVLPSALIKNAWFKDSIAFFIGKIDDTDQAYLNGQLAGQNGVSLSPGTISGNFENFPNTYNLVRRYVFAVSDPRLKWDQENVIAIRVNDHAGLGGFYETGNQSVSMVDTKDFIIIDKTTIPLKADGNSMYSKTLLCVNRSKIYSFKGKFIISVKNTDTGDELFNETSEIELAPSDTVERTFSYKASDNVIAIAQYSFLQEGAKISVRETEAFPFILTPKSPETPRINGPMVYGCRPGNVFLYALPVSGKKPVSITAENLPAGLVLDPLTGIITGTTPPEGVYKVTFTAKNELGTVTRNLSIIAGKQLALTPPMGWNSWNCWGLSVTSDKVKQAADLMVSSGLRDHGWTYINIDDGWESEARNADGTISTNAKFPDMKELSDYVHSKGLKLGIYSSPGPRTCGQYLGSYQHEIQDAKTWAEWGIDYIKYDWCSYSEIAKDNSLEELKKPYFVMKDALSKIDRDIVYSLCQYGMGNVWEWGSEVDGNLWRTTGDIVDTWQSLSTIGFSQTIQAKYARPGNWNDPDMLIVGWVGWGPKLHPTRLSVSEQYTHISLWAMLSAPLLLGNDLSRLDDFTLSLLTNDEVLAINQDPLGIQASLVLTKGKIQVWKKELSDGSEAIGIFNLGEEDALAEIDWKEINVDPEQSVYDVWRQKEIGVSTKYSTMVLAHGVELFKIKSTRK